MNIKKLYLNLNYHFQEQGSKQKGVCVLCVVYSPFCFGDDGAQKTMSSASMISAMMSFGFNSLHGKRAGFSHRS